MPQHLKVLVANRYTLQSSSHQSPRPISPQRGSLQSYRLACSSFLLPGRLFVYAASPATQITFMISPSCPIIMHVSHHDFPLVQIFSKSFSYQLNCSIKNLESFVRKSSKVRSIMAISPITSSFTRKIRGCRRLSTTTT